MRAVLALVAVTFPILAQPGQVAAQKIATVDMARVLREYEEVKQVAFKLQQQKDKYQEQIDAKQQEIKKINDDLQNLSGDAKTQKEKLRKKRLVELQNQFQQLKEKLADMEKESFDQIREKIFREIDKIVAAKGYTMVFERQWLYYPRNGADITDALLSSLSAKFGGAKTTGKNDGGDSGGNDE